MNSTSNMDPKQTPWFFIAGEDRIQSSPANSALGALAPGPYRAVFSARAKPLIHEEREFLKWGFGADSGWKEAVNRQRQFVVSLRNPLFDPVNPFNREPTIALNCLVDPDAGGLRLSLLGAVDGNSEESARSQGSSYWQTLSATFPYDFHLRSLMSMDGFFHNAGYHVLDDLQTCQELVEISRFETFMSTDSGYTYLLGAWCNLTYADEQIWRALSGLSTPALLSIRVQPTTLSEIEWQALKGLSTQIAEAAEKIDSLHSKDQYSRTAEIYDERLRLWLNPYLVQVHLAVPGGVPEYAARAIGSAMSYCTKNDLGLPQYQIRHPENSDQLKSWANNIRQLSFSEPSNKPNGALARFPLMAGVEETLAVCRWPYPPKKEDIGGLTFL